MGIDTVKKLIDCQVVNCRMGIDGNREWELFRNKNIKRIKKATLFGCF